MGFLGITTDKDIENEYQLFKNLSREFELNYKYEPCTNFLVCNAIYAFFELCKNNEFLNKQYSKQILSSLEHELDNQRKRGSYAVDCHGNLLVSSFVRLCNMLPKSINEQNKALQFLLEMKEKGTHYRDIMEHDKSNYCKHLDEEKSLHQAILHIRTEQYNSTASDEIKKIEIQQVIALWDYNKKFIAPFR